MEYGNAERSSSYAASCTVPQGDERGRSDLPRNILTNVPSVSNETIQVNTGTFNVLPNRSCVDFGDAWRLPSAWIRPVVGSAWQGGNWPSFGFGQQPPGAVGGRGQTPSMPLPSRHAAPQQPTFPYGRERNPAASVDHRAPLHRGRWPYSNEAPYHNRESPYRITPVRGQRPLLPDDRQHAPGNTTSTSLSSHREVAAGRAPKSLPAPGAAGDNPDAVSARREAALAVQSALTHSGAGDAPTAAAKGSITICDNAGQPSRDFDPSHSTLASKDSGDMPKKRLCAFSSSTGADRRSYDRQVPNDCPVENAKCEGEDDGLILLDMGCYEEPTASVPRHVRADKTDYVVISSDDDDVIVIEPRPIHPIGKFKRRR